MDYDPEIGRGRCGSALCVTEKNEGMGKREARKCLVLFVFNLNS